MGFWNGCPVVTCCYKNRLTLCRNIGHRGMHYLTALERENAWLFVEQIRTKKD